LKITKFFPDPSFFPLPFVFYRRVGKNGGTPMTPCQVPAKKNYYRRLFMKIAIQAGLAAGLLAVVTIGAFAQTEADFTIYRDSHRYITITGYTGSAVDVVVPATINGAPVDKIGHGAFAGKTAIRSITIPASVRDIDEGAFQGCTGLTSITLPQNLTEIDDLVFAGCTSLASIIIPDMVREIDEGAFRGCTALTSVTLPQNLTEIDDLAFADCSALRIVTLPSGLREISQGAFYGCTALTTVTFPSGPVKVEQGAFTGCVSLDAATQTAIAQRFGTKTKHGWR
jgi:hypothetical protein